MTLNALLIGLLIMTLGCAPHVLSAPSTTRPEADALPRTPDATPPPVTANPSPRPALETRALVKKTLSKATPDALSGPSRELPLLLGEIEKKYAAASTLEATFTQVNELAALKQTKESSGKLMAKRPNKVRWETYSPEKNLLVSDGKKFWFYTPPFDESEQGQLIERKSSQVQSKLANTLLSGSFSLARDLTITQKDDSRYVLIPKKGTAGSVTRAEIIINPVQKLIEKVILEHKGGNRSEISLSQIQLGQPIPDETFRFKAPPNTDRLEE